MQRECSKGCRKDDSQEIQGETWKTGGPVIMKGMRRLNGKETMKEVVVKNEKRAELVKGVQAM